ncbi:MAG: hypothetical protein ABI595_13110 [Actinomycetota bacterium]
MADFLILTEGGSMPENEVDQQQMIEEWGAWSAALGRGMKDPGSPMVSAKMIAPDRTVSDSAGGPFNGYFILTADSVDEAVAMTRGCPVFRLGPSVTVYQTFPMSG